MGSTPVSGGQQEVFPFAYLQSALTHMFEEPEHAGSFTYPCALMLAAFTGELGSTQGQIPRAAVLNTPVIQASSQELNAPPPSKSSTSGERACACPAVRLVQTVCLLSDHSAMRNIIQVRETQGCAVGPDLSLGMSILWKTNSGNTAPHLKDAKEKRGM